MSKHNPVLVHFHKEANHMWTSIKNAVVVVGRNIPVGVGVGIGAALGASILSSLGNGADKFKTQLDKKMASRKVATTVEAPLS